MILSAKRLEERCGLTAEEMNILLKEEGFLSGEPRNYYPTEKGKLFVVEKGDDNGYGGYAFRGWSWFEWDERILEELDTSVENKRYIKEAEQMTREELKAQIDELMRQYADEEIDGATYQQKMMELTTSAQKEIDEE